MTNYNDGKWYGWNGGECPVHPKTVVEMISCEPISVVTVASVDTDTANSFNWNDHDDPIVAFRVLKEYKEPRGGWVVAGLNGGMDIFYTRAAAVKFREDSGGTAAIYYAQEVEEV